MVNQAASWPPWPPHRTRPSRRCRPLHFAGAHGEGQQESRRHGAGGHAARVKGDGRENLRHEKGHGVIAARGSPGTSKHKRRKSPSAPAPWRGRWKPQRPRTGWCSWPCPGSPRRSVSSTCRFSTWTAGSACTMNQPISIPMGTSTQSLGPARRSADPGRCRPAGSPRSRRS